MFYETDFLRYNESMEIMRMRKTAVLIYDAFCQFEISVALEILALSGREIVVFGKTREVVRSEEGLHIVPDKAIDELVIDDYDSLLLPGARDIRTTIEDCSIINFIRQFEGKIIGAMSIAPLLLVKAGMLEGKPFMAGVNKDELLEEGFTDEQLTQMKGWTDCIEHPIEEGYILADNIVTSVAFCFIKFGLQFGKMLGISISPKSFGL